jgi:hypothetical protein
MQCMHAAWRNGTTAVSGRVDYIPPSGPKNLAYGPWTYLFHQRYLHGPWTYTSSTRGTSGPWTNLFHQRYFWPLDLPLPPEVFLDAGPAGGEEVVEVHDDVDAHVQESAERGVTAAHVPAQQILDVSVISVVC